MPVPMAGVASGVALDSAVADWRVTSPWPRSTRARWLPAGGVDADGVSTNAAAGAAALWRVATRTRTGGAAALNTGTAIGEDSEAVIGPVATSARPRVTLGAPGVVDVQPCIRPARATLEASRASRPNLRKSAPNDPKS